MISLQTEIPTPNGFLKLSNLKLGDLLFDDLGNICKITKFNVNDCIINYEVEFDDDIKLNVSEDQLWSSWSYSARNSYTYKKSKNPNQNIISTKDILYTLKFNGHINHSIECCKNLNFKEIKLPIPPYVLGAWLGDGTSKNADLTSADIEIINFIELFGFKSYLKSSKKNNKASTYRIGTLVKNNLFRNLVSELFIELKNNNLLNNKHIPLDYLHSPYEQRLELLQGLLDTDGTSSKTGAIEFCTVIPRLAEETLILIRSLGIKAKCKKSKSYCKGKICKDRYRITFTTSMPVFKLQRKLDRLRIEKTQKNITTHRYINNVIVGEPISMVDISVDSKSKLFLVSRNFIAMK